MVSVAVCAIVRDEGPYVLEWVAWQRLIGFERIVVYDNDSVDGTAHTLARLARAGVLEHVTWPDRPGLAAQLTAYDDAIERMRGGVDWLAFLDLDEFLVLHRHPDVRAFLAGFPPAISAVAVNEAAFGCGGQEEPDGRLVTERFTTRGVLDILPNQWVKSFVRPAAVAQAGIHVCALREGIYADPAGMEAVPIGQDRFRVHEGVAQVNHYILKSQAEFARKAARAGLASDPPGTHPARVRYSAAFFVMHDRNEVEDLAAAERGTAVRAEMERLRGLVE